MDEGRKRVADRRAFWPLEGSQLDGLRRSPAYEAVIADAISAAERIMQRIDAKHPDG